MTIENTQRLAEVGPLDPVHGFPLWFEDGNGVRLELGLGLDQFLPAVEAPVVSTQVPGQPFPAQFPEEAFYFLAESRMPIGGAGTIGRARLILALEAAFATPAPDPRGRIVFARIRVRLDDVVPGRSYVVTHPYGVTGPLVADDDGRVFVTDDRGIAANLFEQVRTNGLVAPFLSWSAGAPAGYLGDGATEHEITGSPFNTNFFRVEGVDVAQVAGALTDPQAPLDLDRIQSSLFTVQARLATRSGVSIDSARYTRTAGVVVLDLHARSAPGQSLEVAGTGLTRTACAGAGRHYTARAATAGTTPPAEVRVINTGDQPSTVAVATVTDLVTGTAQHSPATATLTVTATSSDDTGPQLSVTGFGPLVGGSATFTGVVATPAAVEVVSAAGGIASIPVTLTGGTLGALPLIADAGPDLAAPVGDPVLLDGTASRSDVVGWAWSQNTGPALTLTDASTARAGFIATTAATYDFTLTVTDGAGATASDTVQVVIDDPPPDQLLVTRAEFRTGRGEWRISGTQSGTRPASVSVQFAGVELGGSGVDATGAWSVRRTLLPNEAALRPGVGDSVTALSTRGGLGTAVVTIRT